MHFLVNKLKDLKKLVRVLESDRKFIMKKELFLLEYKISCLFSESSTGCYSMEYKEFLISLEMRKKEILSIEAKSWQQKIWLLG